MTTPKIPAKWNRWCTTGKHGQGGRKKKAVQRSLVNGCVRGCFSDIPLNPELDPSHSMYPSLEHLDGPNNHTETAVEARVINEMKSHLSEKEFWMMVDHLFAIGVKKGKIAPPFGKRLPKGWTPARHYKKIIAPNGVARGSFEPDVQ